MMKDCGSKGERNTGKNKTVLKVEDFRLCFNGRFGAVHAVRDANLEVHRGEIVALVGESGCGKTALCRAILMLHSAHARYLSGRILLDGRDVRTCNEREMEQIRGKAASLVFQNPLSSMNPVYRIREQMEEPMRRHLGMKEAGALEARSRELLLEMGLEEPEEILGKYPHQLSGGQRQRVAVAIALAGNPSLIVADEPTTALDPETAKMVTDLLRRVADEKQKGILFVTHDLAVAAALADRVLVMKNGEILEQGTTEDIFARPKENYTKKLVRCAEWVRGAAPSRNLAPTPEPEEKPLASVRHLKVRYPGAPKPALRDFSLDIREGEILGLIGESGCGKSTLAKVLCGILKPSAGEVEFFRPVKPVLIFQDSVASFNERMTIGEIIQEPLVIGKVPPERRRETLRELTEQVELEAALLDRYPYEVSGGQRQRAAIARGLAMDPEFLIADEPVSSLDAPVQMEILRLLKRLRDRRNLTLLIISHDIPMVEHISDRIIRMEKEGPRDAFK